MKKRNMEGIFHSVDDVFGRIFSFSPFPEHCNKLLYFNLSSFLWHQMKIFLLFYKPILLSQFLHCNLIFDNHITLWTVETKRKFFLLRCNKLIFLLNDVDKISQYANSVCVIWIFAAHFFQCSLNCSFPVAASFVFSSFLVQNKKLFILYGKSFSNNTSIKQNFHSYCHYSCEGNLVFILLLKFHLHFNVKIYLRK